MIVIGEIVKAQGVKGELKIMPMTDNEERFLKLKSVVIDGETRDVTSARVSPNGVFITIKGVDDRNAAELLRGKEMQALRSDLPQLPDGRYYIADLTGCTVVNERGDRLGEVIYVTPAKTDVYTLLSNGKEINFAAADGVITEVDVAAKKITVNGKRFREVSL